MWNIFHGIGVWALHNGQAQIKSLFCLQPPNFGERNMHIITAQHGLIPNMKVAQPVKQKENVLVYSKIYSTVSSDHLLSCL